MRTLRGANGAGRDSSVRTDCGHCLPLPDSPYSGPMDPKTSTFQHIFPVRAPLGTTFTGGTISLLPWSAAAFYGLLGTTGAGAPLLAVASEWPLIWVRTAAPLSKFERELLYLRRYSSDQAIATRGNHAWGDVQPGDGTSPGAAGHRGRRGQVDCYQCDGCNRCSQLLPWRSWQPHRRSPEQICSECSQPSGRPPRSSTCILRSSLAPCVIWG